jgi:tetratricopeptide (TPR) repeat protein
MSHDDEGKGTIREGGNMITPQPSGSSYVGRAWEAFYEGDFQQATETTPQRAKTLERFIMEAPGSWQTTVKMLIQLYNVAGTSARDRMATQVSLGYLTKAKQEAESYGDPELLVITLLQLFNAFMQFGLYSEAECIKDLALVYMRDVRDVAVVGLVYLAAGELYSTLSTWEHSNEYAGSTYKYLDLAEHAWTTTGRDSVSNHMRFTLTGVLNERATFSANQGLLADAERTLGRARDSLAGSDVRHKKDYHLATSRLAIVNGDTLGACDALRESLRLHAETNSHSNFVYMFRDLGKLKRMAPTNNAVLMIEETLRTQ